MHVCTCKRRMYSHDEIIKYFEVLKGAEEISSHLISSDSWLFIVIFEFSFLIFPIFPLPTMTFGTGLRSDLSMCLKCAEMTVVAQYLANILSLLSFRDPLSRREI